MKNKRLSQKSDQILLEKIKSRIRWDIRVSNSDLSLLVKNGIVTLYGYFDKSYRHSAAINIIIDTEGVKEVKDLSLVIQDYFRADQELEILISKKIINYKFLPGEWIDVDVCDGVVKLEGCVFRTRLKAFAGSACWELSGIKDCINLISLKDPPDELKMSNYSRSNEPPSVSVSYA